MKRNKWWSVCRVRYLVWAAIALFLLCGFYRGLRVTQIEYFNDKIPEEFDGYKIVHITDLHCRVFGREQEKLIRTISEQQPDIIVFTGDMFDRERWNYEGVRNLLEGICQIAPVYAVTGNNEYDDNDMFHVLMQLYDEYDIHILNDDKVTLTREGAEIYLYGMYYRYYVADKYFTFAGDKNQFNILLYHDPAQFPKLRKNSFSLILAGHTHGGLIRLPFIGGVIDNSYALFPEYDYGMFQSDGCDMFVSTGLGDVSIPRFYNRPEVVVITLRSHT